MTDSRDSTPQLYDNEEESWKLKLHIGNGSVYLSDSGTGYVNCDIDGVLSSRNPELVKSNRTDIKNYYARLEGRNMNRLPVPRQTVADLICDFTELPYGPSTVSKIVSIQAFEHVTPGWGRITLLHFWNILKPGGTLILSVPDVPQTIQLLKNPNTLNFGIRHLEGSLKNKYSQHNSWYSTDSLLELLDEMGFNNLQLLPNIHLYPAVVIKCQKLDAYVRDRSYQYPLPEYDSTCVNVLDVGPGNFPLPFATRCFDKDDEYKDSRIVPCDTGDIYHLPYQDDEFDYAYLSHCVEHLEHPAHALKEVMRVSRKGYIECPSACLDYSQQHGKTHPYWMSLQAPNGIVMVEKSKDIQFAFTDDTVGAYMHRITQYPITLSKSEQDIRMQFWRNQKVLNVSASWNKDTGKVARVIEVRLNGEVI